MAHAEKINETHEAIGAAFAAGDLLLETRLEARLYCLCVEAGMDHDEPDHIEWAAGYVVDAWS